MSLAALRDYAFGYDIFISYDFDQAGDFAEQLKALAESDSPPIRCFLDRQDFIIGNELKAATRRRLRASRHVAVIVTPGVGAAESWVPKELEIFTRNGRRRLDRIAPLNVDGALEKLPADAEILKYLPFSDGPDSDRSVLFQRISRDEFETAPADATLKRLQALIGSHRVDRTRLRFFQAATAVLLVLAISAGILALIATHQREAARQARDRAIAALRTQSRLLLDSSHQAMLRGDALGSYLLALEGLPDSSSEDSVRRQWPHVAELEAHLFNSLKPLHERRLLSAQPSSGPFMLNEDGSRLLNGGELRDARSGELIVEFMKTTAEVPTIKFARHGEWVVWLDEGRARAINSADGNEIDNPLPVVEDISGFGIFFDLSGSTAVTIHDDGRLLLQRPGGSAIELRGPEENSQGYSELAFWGEVSFRPQQQVIALTWGQPEAELWHVGEARLLATLRESNNIRGVIFQPTGERFVTLPESRQGGEVPVHVYDADSGRQLSQLRGHRAQVSDAEFSPDGSRLITAGTDNTARIWDLASGQEVAKLEGHTTNVERVWFVGSKRQNILTKGSSSNGLEQDDVYLRLWKGDGRLLKTLSFADAWLSDLSLNGDRSRVAASFAKAGTRVWNLDSGELEATLTAHRSYIRDTLFDRSDDRLLTLADDGTLRFWALGSSQQWLSLLDHPSSLQERGEYFVWTPPLLLGATAREAENAESALSIATWAAPTLHSSHQQLHIWSLAGPQPTHLRTDSLDAESAWPFLSQGLLIHTENGQGQLILQDLFTAEIKDRYSPEAAVSCVTVDRESELWVVAQDDATAVLRNFATKTEVGRIHLGDSEIAELALDGSEKRLVTLSADGDVHWWRIASPTPIASWRAEEGSETRLVHDPRSARIAIIADRSAVEVFDFSSENHGRLALDSPINLVPRSWRGEPVMALSPDGGRAAVATGHLIEVHDVETGELISTLEGHEQDVIFERDFAAINYTSSAQVRSLVFLADGERLLSASADGTAKIWNARTGENVGTLAGHGASVANRVANLTRTDVPERFFFSGVTQALPIMNDRYALTSSEDGTTRRWPLYASTQALVEHVQTTATRCLSPAQRLAYRLDPEPPAWCIDQAKWPYDSAAWREWSTARAEGEVMPMPEVAFESE